MLHHTTYYHVGLITVYPVVITATMLHPGSLVTRFLELAPMRFLGRISYSLYLWQQLFFNDLHPAAPHSLYRYPLLCWLGAFACAIASYYLVETPLIRVGHLLAKRAAPGHTLPVANVAGGIPS
jgi:peptidoglycan/LPS O-acetylase OafA/YrhL